jgi:DNA polymerase/3'-5' exonuclease PolX
MSQNKEIPYKTAWAVAKKIVQELSPACERVEIAGSLRRAKPAVHDIDIVLLPRLSSGVGLQASASRLDEILSALINRGSLRVVRDGDKIRSFIATKTGIPIDIYIATHDTWATLLLIRTGSREHNIQLAQRARQLGMKLRASGDGIENQDGELIKIQSEDQIFTLLKVPYFPPQKRG